MLNGEHLIKRTKKLIKTIRQAYGIDNSGERERNGENIIIEEEIQLSHWIENEMKQNQTKPKTYIFIFYIIIIHSIIMSYSISSIQFSFTFEYRDLAQNKPNITKA